jgi:hypothetical protein
LANNFRVNEPKPGRNATGGFTIIIKRSRPSCQIVLGTWNPSSWLSSVQWRYSLVTDKLTATMRIVKRVHALAQEQNDSTLMIGGCVVLAVPLYFLGDFETARKYSMLGVQLWRWSGVQCQVEEVTIEEVTGQAVGCLFFEALLLWHIGESPLAS